MNCEKLRSPSRFRNPNFQSLCELGKTWKYSLRPKFKNPDIVSREELGKLCLNLSFTKANKIIYTIYINKATHISNLNEVFNLPKSSEFINELEKMEFFAHIVESLALGKALIALIKIE